MVFVLCGTNIAPDNILRLPDVTANDPVMTAFPENGNTFASNAYDAVVAKTALEILPKNDPLNEPVRFVAALTNARTKMTDCEGGAVTKLRLVVLSV